MSSGRTGEPAALSNQHRHQLRLWRKRMTWWIPAIFVAGFGVSILGLIPALAVPRPAGIPPVPVLVFALFSLLFGWASVLGLSGPHPIRPRIVPYFTRALGEYGGPAMISFARGRALYREIAALDQLAGSLRVTPLSVFGFAYDHWDQEVRWHAAAAGLETCEALRQGLGPGRLAAPDVVEDLVALAAVLRLAAAQGVEFCLVLRLHAHGDLQGLAREDRQGSFW